MIDPGKAIELARASVLRQVRDRGDLFIVFVLPVLVIAALGLQFGGDGPARLGVVAPTGDPAATELINALKADDTELDVRSVADEPTLQAQVERGELQAGVVIPDAFGPTLRAGDPIVVHYLAGGIGASALRAPVEAAVARLDAIVIAARVAAEEGAGSFDEAAAAAREALATVPEVAVDVSIVGEPAPLAGFSRFTFGASTQLVMFMFLTSLIAAARLVGTRQLGVSRRMLAGPTTVATIVAGESMGRCAIALLQAVYIVLVAALVFGVSWGDPIAACAVIALFMLVSAGAAMLIGAVAGSPDQAGSIGLFVGLTLGALGGCMIPIQLMPEAMQSVARLLPHSWAVLGLQSLMRDPATGMAGIAPNLAALAIYGVATMGLAAWRFRRAITA
jgi:ABC-2 type transport system permease protein